MIRLRNGDLLASSAQTLVNTVNCVGVMGKGIALDFRNKHPEMYRDYRRRCSERSVRPGEPYLYDSSDVPLILNFPTKNHWKSPSKISYLHKGLQILVENYKEWGIKSIAVPPLGCGNGGLDWNEVGPVIYDYLTKLDIPVELFVPPHVVADNAEKRRLEAFTYSVSQAQLPLGLMSQGSSGNRRTA